MNLKQPRIKLPRWTQAAKGQTCVGCDGMRCDSETTVAAHVKIKGVTNHGGSMKNDEMWISFLGSKCHIDLDNSLDFRDTNEKLRLVMKTWRALYEMGILK